jgi:hypothetical protein
MAGKDAKASKDAKWPCEDCGAKPGAPCKAPPGERCIEGK